MSGALLGVIVGIFPTVSMLGASIILTKVDVPSKVEAGFQNFCAGLMIAAVAGELFPLIMKEKGFTLVIGVTFGFVCALGLIKGVEITIGYFEHISSQEVKLNCASSINVPTLLSHVWDKLGFTNKLTNYTPADNSDHHEMNSSTSTEVPVETTIPATPMDQSFFDEADFSPSPKNMDKVRFEGLWDEHAVDLAMRAMKKGSHRSHIFEHILELRQSILLVESIAHQLFDMRNYSSIDDFEVADDVEGGGEEVCLAGHSDFMTAGNGVVENPLRYTSPPLGKRESSASNTPTRETALNTRKNAALGHLVVQTSEGGLPLNEKTPLKIQKAKALNSFTEKLAEDIDEEIHKFQYKLDHCKRLVEGSESGLFVNNQKSLDIAKMEYSRGKIGEIKESVEHLILHLNYKGPFDSHIMQEIRIHMDDIDEQLREFHDSIHSHASKWKRSRPFPETDFGESIPIGLIVPVCIDSIVDGFLIGIAVSASFSAGLILAIANCLEMGFLGMALASRVMKCTGSSITLRYLGIIIPPLLMLMGSCAGGLLGNISLVHPIFFVSLVSFGTVAILYLVCTELLIEAKEASEDDWRVTLSIFAGVYLVIILSTIV